MKTPAKILIVSTAIMLTGGTIAIAADASIDSPKPIAISRAAGNSIEKMQAVPIAKLPEMGSVKLTGTVDNVTDQDSFTVKDATGAVDVVVQSDENIVVTKGSKVTVLGYINNKPIFGRDIHATQVVVTADSASR